MGVTTHLRITLSNFAEFFVLVLLNAYAASLGVPVFKCTCGAIVESSMITLLFPGLVVGMFLDDAGKEVENQDPDCGLFIRSRQVGARERKRENTVKKLYGIMALFCWRKFQNIIFGEGMASALRGCV